MKQTLLKHVQDVLSSIDGDEVTSINDTTESTQVVKIIKRVWGNLAEGADLPEQYTLFGLTASGDTDLPVVMYLPTDTVKNLYWVKYDCKQTGETDTDFQPIPYVSLEEFLNRMHSLKPTEDDSLDTMTITVAGQDVEFIFRTDQAPSYYTTTDDSTLIFDSYDSEVDTTTLDASKTLAYGEAVLPWTESDSFIIPMDDHQLILNESIALAWAELKQSVNQKAEREVMRQQKTLQRKKHSIDPGANYRVPTPNYGRK